MYNFGIQNPNFNPYEMQNRYQPPIQNNQNSLIRVTGIDGAKAFQMPPNSTTALFDNNEDYFYVKTTDGAGFPTIRTFRFEEVNQTQTKIENDFVSKNDLETFRKEMEEYVKQFIQQPKNKQAFTTDGISKQLKEEQSRSIIPANVSK